jgi:hypothetical protein
MRSRRDAHKGRVSDNNQTKHSARHKRMEKSGVWGKRKKKEILILASWFWFFNFSFPKRHHHTSF